MCVTISSATCIVGEQSLGHHEVAVLQKKGGSQPFLSDIKGLTQEEKTQKVISTPNVGIEPTTTRLRVVRSTD